MISRYVRAVKERGIRYLYIRLFPDLSLKDNLAFLENLSVALAGEHFQSGHDT